MKNILKKKYRFIVPGKAVGYVTTTRNSKWAPEYKKFADYAKKVREYAARAGVPLPLYADEENQVLVKTITYFPNRIHCDPGNVQKGICDILFLDLIAKKSGKRGKGDKQTGGSFPPPRYDGKNPRVVVILKPYPKSKMHDVHAPKKKDKKKRRPK